MAGNSDIISYSDMISSGGGEGVRLEVFGWSGFGGGYDNIVAGVLVAGKLYWEE